MNGNGNGAALVTPTRNRYFYGKLLDAFHFELEQRYGNDKRWLLSRLLSGSGVVCGLDVLISGDDKVCVTAGVALDGRGREIVVPTGSRAVDPRQPTDDRGVPDGDPIAGEGVVTVSVVYLECDAEPVPVLVGDCDTEQGCAPSVVQERYAVCVEAADPPMPEHTCGLPGVFAPDAPPLHGLLADAVTEACPEPNGRRVTLARVALPAEGAPDASMIDTGVRGVVLSHDRLLELIVCLAGHVEECCDQLRLVMVSGNQQTAAPGATLAAPLVVEVVDADGDPAAGEAVTFKVAGGGGGVADGGAPAESVEVTSGGDGRAAAKWALGDAPGGNEVRVTIGSGAVVIFTATAVADPPVVNAVWPPPSAVLRPGGDTEPWFKTWIKRARIELAFDRAMDAASLGDPDPWLRVWQLINSGQNENTATRLKLARDTNPPDPMLGEEGVSETYALDTDGFARDEPARYVIIIRSEDGAIVEAGGGGLALDADFSGTALPVELADELWEIDGSAGVPQEMWDALTATADQLPSGDGVPGGRLTSFFEIAKEA